MVMAHLSITIIVTRLVMILYPYGCAFSCRDLSCDSAPAISALISMGYDDDDFPY
jgi:hypothetical protein